MICVQILLRKALEGARRLFRHRSVIAAFYKGIFRASLQVPGHFLSERFLLFPYDIQSPPYSGDVCRTGAGFDLWKTEALLVAHTVLPAPT